MFIIIMLVYSAIMNRRSVACGVIMTAWKPETKAWTPFGKVEGGSAGYPASVEINWHYTKGHDAGVIRGVLVL